MHLKSKILCGCKKVLSFFTCCLRLFRSIWRWNIKINKNYSILDLEPLIGLVKVRKFQCSYNFFENFILKISELWQCEKFIARQYDADKNLISNYTIYGEKRKNTSLFLATNEWRIKHNADGNKVSTAKGQAGSFNPFAPVWVHQECN